jgi:hypothetical protein
MAYRVTSTGRALTLEARKLANALEADPKFRNTVGQRLRRSYKASAHNAFFEIDRLLNQGVGNGIGAGMKTIVAKDPAGKTVTVHTEYWPALNARYARGGNPSRNFWTKRPFLAPAFGVEIGRTPDVTVKQIALGRSHHKGTVRLGYNVGLKGPFQRAAWKFIAMPFVSGDPGYAGGKSGLVNLGYSRYSSELLGYPEAGPYRRPFLRKLSAALGTRARTALRKLD